MQSNMRLPQRSVWRCYFLALLLVGLVGFVWGPRSVAAPRTQMLAPSISFSTGHEMRLKKRMNVGLDFAGALGAMGTHLELNFTPANSLLLGYGGGPSFKAFTFQYKRYLGGSKLLPYLGLGYANWSNNKGSNGPIDQIEPSLLQEKFLSPESARLGIVNEHFLIPSVGLQFVQLSGPWLGMGIGAELLLLMDIVDLVMAPTGQVSLFYYF